MTKNSMPAPVAGVLGFASAVGAVVGGVCLLGTISLLTWEYNKYNLFINDEVFNYLHTGTQLFLPFLFAWLAGTDEDKITSWMCVTGVAMLLGSLCVASCLSIASRLQMAGDILAVVGWLYYLYVLTLPVSIILLFVTLVYKFLIQEGVLDVLRHGKRAFSSVSQTLQAARKPPTGNGNQGRDQRRGQGFRPTLPDRQDRHTLPDRQDRHTLPDRQDRHTLPDRQVQDLAAMLGRE